MTTAWKAFALCCRPAIDEMMKIYLDIIYPLYVTLLAVGCGITSLTISDILCSTNPLCGSDYINESNLRTEVSDLYR
jgi:hypothetical protein